ncbi:MAG: Mur ligase family protein, partial [Candidatus Pacearchaeota archaeon]|nr:Mur ligase family protein [Candidatus Pacearchaeota archaeon]
KGKGTTASLITQVLRAGGVATELMGNIGNPALSFLSKTKKDTVVVFELSSFQLLGLEKSPHIAVLVNVYPEHLDYHGSFEAYREAKARITLFQGPKDILIYEEENDGCREIAKHTKAKKIAFTKSAPMIPGRLPFVASPNPAVIIGRMYKVPEAVIKKATLSFEPLPHRLEPVGTFRGITFVNDSMGTTMPAVIAAIETLKGEVATIILGGRGKGESSYDELAQAVVESGIKHVILFPETGGEIWKAVEQLKKGRFPEAREAHDMEEAVRLCYELTRKGKTCLLSPAAASFNMFRDYKDRGEQFAKYAKHYGKEK